MITSIDQMKKIIPTIVGNDFDMYEPEHNNALAWLETRIVGAKIYAQLGADSKLEQLADRAVAYKAYLETVPKIDLMNNGNGFIVVADEHYQPASRDRVKALEESIRRSLVDALAAVYEYIEDHKTHEEYASFAYGSIVPESLLPTLRTYERYRRHEGGYPAWIDLKQKHQWVRIQRFDPRFGTALMADAIAKQSGEEYKEVIDAMRYAFASALSDDWKSYQTGCDAVERALRAYPEKYPLYTPTNPAEFSSNSVFSMI